LTAAPFPFPSHYLGDTQEHLGVIPAAAVMLFAAVAAAKVRRCRLNR